MSDPLRDALARRKAAKRRGRTDGPPAGPPEQRFSLVTQGGRSVAPRGRPREKHPDEMIRDARAALLNRESWTRIE
jgi:hypothetical protein